MLRERIFVIGGFHVLLCFLVNLAGSLGALVESFHEFECGYMSCVENCQKQLVLNQARIIL